MEKEAGLLHEGFGPLSSHLSSETAEWLVAMRTSVLDEWILESIEDGVDTVLNLGAGLDSRPYRLTLPRALHWIDADLPSVSEKNASMLAGMEPVCRLSRVGLDLRDPEARDGLFARVQQEGRRTLVITESLLHQLPEQDVRCISQQMLYRSSIAVWLMDIVDKSLLDPEVEHPFHPTIAYFEEQSWRVNAFHTLHEQGLLLDRPAPSPFPGAQKTGIVSLVK